MLGKHGVILIVYSCNLCFQQHTLLAEDRNWSQQTLAKWKKKAKILDLGGTGTRAFVTGGISFNSFQSLNNLVYIQTPREVSDWLSLSHMAIPWTREYWLTETTGLSPTELWAVVASQSQIEMLLSEEGGWRLDVHKWLTFTAGGLRLGNSIKASMSAAHSEKVEPQAHTTWFKWPGHSCWTKAQGLLQATLMATWIVAAASSLASLLLSSSFYRPSLI